MITVWKYDLELAAEQALELPEDAELLHVDWQHGRLQLWARVDTELLTERRRILITGTGNWAPTALPHIGSVLTGDELYVWHLFDGGVA